MRWSGQGVPPDEAGAQRLYRRAAKFYRARCDANDIEACATVARMTLLGHGTPADATVARTLFASSCGRGDGPSCIELGRLWERSVGGGPDPGRAKQYYDRGTELASQGCESGSASACLMLASRWASNRQDRIVPGSEERVRWPTSALIPPDPKRAAAAWRKACRLKSAEACFRAGRQLIRSSGEKCLACTLLFREACALGNPPGCLALHKHRHRLQAAPGVSVPTQAEAWRLRERANENYRRSCHGGSFVRCADLAELLSRRRSRRGQRAKAGALLELGCAGQNARSCLQLARLHQRELGRIAQRAPDAPLSWKPVEQAYRRACHLGMAVACGHYWLMPGVHPPPPSDSAPSAMALPQITTQQNERLRLLLDPLEYQRMRCCSDCLRACSQPLAGCTSSSDCLGVGWLYGVLTNNCFRFPKIGGPPTVRRCADRLRQAIRKQEGYRGPTCLEGLAFRVEGLCFDRTGFEVTIRNTGRAVIDGVGLDALEARAELHIWTSLEWAYRRIRPGTTKKVRAKFGIAGWRWRPTGPVAPAEGILVQVTAAMATPDGGNRCRQSKTTVVAPPCR